VNGVGSPGRQAVPPDGYSTALQKVTRSFRGDSVPFDRRCLDEWQSSRLDPGANSYRKTSEGSWYRRAEHWLSGGGEVTEKDQAGQGAHAAGPYAWRQRWKVRVARPVLTSPAVDETGVGSGMYYLAEYFSLTVRLHRRDDALNFMKPKVVPGC